MYQTWWYATFVDRPTSLVSLIPNRPRLLVSQLVPCLVCFSSLLSFSVFSSFSFLFLPFLLSFVNKFLGMLQKGNSVVVPGTGLIVNPDQCMDKATPGPVLFPLPFHFLLFVIPSLPLSLSPLVPKKVLPFY